MDKNLYNQHFHDMIIEGVCCGSLHPVEWLVGYSRGIGQDNNKLSEINEFIDQASKELFEFDQCRKPIDDTEIQSWIDKYYDRP